VINLIIASIPAMGLALIFGKHIKALLFSPIPVASAFIVGGLIIFWAERRQQKISIAKSYIKTVDDLMPMDAFKVGLAQCAALIPGTSRSGATIIGGMLFGLPRAVATEFSFFLAIPVIGGATAYEFIHYVAGHNFIPFAWYRIVFGVLVLFSAYSGLVAWSQ
ncbi:MAG: undecaprenyl-diphosphatase, partial [Polynucleobacter sp. 35-46-207]